MHGAWPFDLTRDRGMRIIIDLGRLPDDPGQRADIDYALRILTGNQMVEWLEWDGERGRDTGPAGLEGSLQRIP